MHRARHRGARLRLPVTKAYRRHPGSASQIARGTWAVVHTPPAALDLFDVKGSGNMHGYAGCEEAAQEYETRLWTQCLR